MERGCPNLTGRLKTFLFELIPQRCKVGERGRFSNSARNGPSLR